MINDFIGNTPIIKIKDTKNKIYFKHEGLNIFGSSKDRAAYYVLNKLLKEKIINKNTIIIESSSGNMGVALSAICKLLNLKFLCVIDPNISDINKMLIENYGGKVIEVKKKDKNNSYLKARLKKIKQLLSLMKNVYWFNQYDNLLVVEAYKNTIGKEIIEYGVDFDYVFVAVSSLGTIAGISNALFEKDPKIKVIAVDVEGSKIFDNETKTKRYISGIGSSIKCGNADRARIYEKIIIKELDGIKGCYELLGKHLIFAGGSGGCVYSAMKEFVKKNKIVGKKLLCLLNDRGERYSSTIYNKDWVKDKYDWEVSNEIL